MEDTVVKPCVRKSSKLELVVEEADLSRQARVSKASVAVKSNNSS